MLDRLLPPFVASSEMRADLLDITLCPSELDALGNAVEKRRREFTTGRACARRALERLGEPATAIPAGPHGEPLWPPGVVGSITHCSGFRASAVARTNRVAAIGIDAEPNVALPPGLFEEIAFGTEREPSRALETSAVEVPRLLFSAKEAVYKAWFGLTQRWLGFEDVEISMSAESRSFRATLRVEGPMVDDARLRWFDGRWAAEDGLLCTAVVVTRSGP